MLENLNFSLIDSSRLLAFGKSIKSIFSQFDAAKDPYVLAPFVNLLGSSLKSFMQAYERESKNPFTLKLANGDELRDWAFYCYRDYVASFEHMEDDDLRESATRLLDVIYKHGWSAPHYGYKSETAAITKMINETKDFCMADVGFINATSRFDHLVARENEFEELLKSSVTRPDDGLPTIVETRPKLIDAIRKLLNMVDNHYSANPADQALGGYIKAINELIVQTMTVARASQTRQVNSQKSKPAQGTQPTA